VKGREGKEEERRGRVGTGDLSPALAVYRVPTLLQTKKNPGLFQDLHEKFSRTFSEPTNA